MKIKWSNLDYEQIRGFAEHSVKMDLMSFGFKVYFSCDIKHRNDLVIRTNNGELYEVVIRILEHNKRFEDQLLEQVNFEKQDNLYFLYIVFTDNYMPESYLISSIEFDNILRKYQNNDGEAVDSSDLLNGELPFSQNHVLSHAVTALM